MWTLDWDKTTRKLSLHPWREGDNHLSTLEILEIVKSFNENATIELPVSFHNQPVTITVGEAINIVTPLPIPPPLPPPVNVTVGEVVDMTMTEPTPLLLPAPIMTRDATSIRQATIIPRRRTPTEVWSVNGRTCPVCWRTPHEQVAVLECNHFMCGECHDKMTKLDHEHIVNTGGVNGEIMENGIGPEAVRRAEGADKCPMCRSFSYVTTILQAV